MQQTARVLSPKSWNCSYCK